ncbi:MAG: hypothetical protein LBK82_08300 [Planctomycetaceae bacterium]|nr:hypothetical protein [Planctomycetaceae bacterium]
MTPKRKATPFAVVNLIPVGEYADATFQRKVAHLIDCLLTKIPLNIITIFLILFKYTCTVLKT